jgi:hypothetical protein
MALRRPFTRDQRMTVILGMLAFVVMLVLLQLWLLTATMNAYLGGDDSVVWPAAGPAALSLATGAANARIRLTHPARHDMPWSRRRRPAILPVCGQDSIPS